MSQWHSDMRPLQIVLCLDLAIMTLKENDIGVFIYTSFIFFLNRKIILLAGWALFLFLAYKVSKTDREYQEYNPYEVLNLDPVSSMLSNKRVI